ncbi:hypothetical protein ACFQPB_22275 [Hydrogenophaga atypica]|uniref:Uncharacterized protein n=1 Tax=Hydrogenophaga atypica TaxID=249409 RepID=A0ABW2QQD9_9BURK
MSSLLQRISKLEEVAPKPDEGCALAITAETETPEQAIARAKAQRPRCRKYVALCFVTPTHGVDYSKAISKVNCHVGNDHGQP